MMLKYPFTLTIVSYDTPDAMNGTNFKVGEELMEVRDKYEQKEILGSFYSIKGVSLAHFLAKQMIQSVLLEMTPNKELSEIWFIITKKDEQINL